MKQAVRDPSTTTPEDIITRGMFDTAMRFYCVVIDDEMAADLLLYNIAPVAGTDATNRKPSKVKIAEYAHKMITGEWYLNPQPLIFTERNGKGVIEQGDGQQRLLALREVAKQKPGFSAPFVVCIDAPLMAKMVVDQGKPRQLADWLRMSGEVMAAPLSHAVKMLYCYKEVQPFTSIAAWRAVKLTPAQQGEYLAKHPALRQGLQIARDTKTLINPYVGAVLWYLMREEYGAFTAAQFMTGLATGADLKIGDPRLALREFLSKKKLDGYPWDGFEQLGLLLTAVNASLRESDSYKPGSAYKKTDKRFPALIAKDKLPERLFTQETLVSFTEEEMLGELPGL